MNIDIDALAQEIRRVDGSNSLGAGALAEALMPFLSANPANPTPPGWPDPLESPQAEAIRNGKLDDTEIRNLFDCMERELRLHRERAANPAQVTDAMVAGFRSELSMQGYGDGDIRRALTAAIGAAPKNDASAAIAEMRQTTKELRENANGDCNAARQAIYWEGKADALEAAIGADGQAVAEGLHLTEYEIQVLLGTSIHGCNMSPDRVFSLDMAWHRLHALDLIDRTDGLAIVTEKGERVIATILSVIAHPVQPGWPQESHFRLEWIGAPRPPVHPNPMTGRQSFPTLEGAIAFMRRQPADARFVSLREFATTKIDRTDEARVRLSAAPQPKGE